MWLLIIIQVHPEIDLDPYLSRTFETRQQCEAAQTYKFAEYSYMWQAECIEIVDHE